MAFLLVVNDLDAPRVRPPLAAAFGRHGHDEMRRRAPGGIGVRLATRGTRLLLVADDESLPPVLADLAGELSKAGTKIVSVHATVGPASKGAEIRATRQEWAAGNGKADDKAQAEAEALIAQWKKDGSLNEGSEAAVDLALALVSETRAGSQRWSQVMFRKRPAARHAVFVEAIEAGEEVTLEDLGGRRAVRRKVPGGSSHLAVLDDEGLALVEAALKKRASAR